MFCSYRKVGKRKAVDKADKSGSKAKKGKLAKDPNKPKRPPSAFFVFLYVSFLGLVIDFHMGSEYLFSICSCDFAVRSLERHSKRKILM